MIQLKLFTFVQFSDAKCSLSERAVFSVYKLVNAGIGNMNRK